jgi:hypothetical protein
MDDSSLKILLQALDGEAYPPSAGRQFLGAIRTRQLLPTRLALNLIGATYADQIGQSDR